MVIEGRPIATVKFGARLAKLKVSIFIPYYNEKDTIERILEAVRSPAIVNKEIIVVDDCSQEPRYLSLPLVSGYRPVSS